ncbi:P-loop containing nucleoside triphosphate hydrolase protein [Gilbertella persicaria]|uniref:P-loop containing nucleoside triphosphate hydrolase protein n=1 Tax=Gilbertella persicaria TaxID=101096 RepID=UPI00221E8217|nr:P-loop containing nucleoside triphosphate hydrolase protein [Gilbertella persicaria]KAI8083287.1 P-loop containing nucleoside triphosphate hydrolase protein [Gilbertella persicaria]
MTLLNSFHLSGPSCSGKTTATRILRQVLKKSVVVYQDDFYKPEEQVPIHQESQLKNWDCPESVDFDKFAAMIQHVRTHQGQLPKGYDSNEELNVHDGSSHVSSETMDHIKHLLAPFVDDVFVFVDGFMLYWDAKVASQLDCKFDFSSDYQVLKSRREQRQGYHTLEGYWVDPPGYFDRVVWPEYLRLHQHEAKDVYTIDTTQHDINQTVVLLAQKIVSVF